MDTTIIRSTSANDGIIGLLLRHLDLDLNLPFNMSGRHKTTLLEFLFWDKYVNIAPEFIESERNPPNLTGDSVILPLHMAVLSGTTDIVSLVDLVKHLLSKGANPNTANPDGRTPLSYAAGRSSMDLV
jgi:ankyrin repeat protein